MEDDEQPGMEDILKSVMGMIQQGAQMQVNGAELTITWQEYGHTFAVKSLNPISAFKLMEQVKNAAAVELGKKQVIKDEQ